MSIGFYINRNSVYAIFRQQIKGKKINLTFYPGIKLRENDKWINARYRTEKNRDINNRLNKIEEAILDIRDEYDLSEMDSNKFSDLILSKINSSNKKQTSFFQYCDRFLEDARKKGGHEFANSFGTVINKLRTFAPKLTFETINKRFYRDFVIHLEKNNHAQNTIAALIRDLKRILNKATEDEVNKNTEFEKFSVDWEEVYNIYLTEKEIELLYNLQITDDMAIELQKEEAARNGKEFYSSKSNIARQINALDRARKLFIIGCWTGLRVENYLNIDPDIQIDIESGFLHAIANKNGPKLKIPLHRIVREIVLNSGFPEPICAQKLNNHIKELGRLAGINDTIIYSRTIGGKRKEFAKKKYELITSHTARRSFASNLLVRGIPKQYIMAVTGHSTESSFNKYTKAVQKDMLTEKLSQYDVWK